MWRLRQRKEEPMEENKAWQELLSTVQENASKQAVQPKFKIHWLGPNRLVLSGTRQIQARFIAEPGKYAIFFERFGAEISDQNFDLPPGVGRPKRPVSTMLLEPSKGEAFWRFNDGQTLKTAEVARRVVRRLQEFHQEYGMSMLNPAI